MSTNKNTTCAISRDDLNKVLFSLYRLSSALGNWNEEKRERRLVVRTQAYIDLRDAVQLLEKYDKD